jgi:hypothetical protein
MPPLPLFLPDSTQPRALRGRGPFRLRLAFALAEALGLWLGLGPEAPTGRAVAATIPPPANDAFASAIVISQTNATLTQSNAGATKQPGEPNHAGDPGGRSVWWTWIAPFTGSVLIHTAGSTFDTLLAVYSGDAVNALDLVAANDQDLLDPLGGDTSRVKFVATAGIPYRLAVDGYAAASGTIMLTISPPPRPPNDAFAAAFPLAGSTFSTRGSNQDATLEPGEPAHDPLAGGQSVWWTWLAPATGPVVLSTRGSDFDTVLAVYTGEAVDDLIWIAANDQDPAGGDTSSVWFEARAGTRYAIAVDGWNGESGHIVLSLERPPGPPVLQDPSVRPNGDVALTLLGAPGQVGIIEQRSLVHPVPAPWTPVSTNTVAPSGAVQIVLPRPTASPAHVFRARWR